MFRASLRSLLAHKLRLLLSATAVVLGVAFVAGSLIFTDTLGATFTRLFETVSADLTVTQKASYDAGLIGTTGSSAAVGAGVPDSVVATIARVPGVRAAEGRAQVDGVYVVGSNGDVVGGTGAPGLGIDWPADLALSAEHLTVGRPPTTPGEVAVDLSTADRGKVKVGDTLRVLTPKGVRSEHLVGLFRFGKSNGLAGATLVAFDKRTARSFMASPTNTQVQVAAASGVSQTELKRRVLAALPSGYDAKTKDEQVKANATALQKGLSFINTFLLVFAGIALFVGSFIILNTFSMLVAQRSRELALLRAIGATRRQVTTSVLVEAAAVGLVGATLGLGVGFLLAVGLRALFGTFGLTLDGGLVFAWPTVLWAYVVGLLVTLFAAYLPARRASRIPPVAALRDDVALPERTLRLRFVLGVVLAVVGVVALVGGVIRSGGRGAAFVGIGGLLLVVAAIVVSPVLGRPALQLLGAGLPRVYGATGRLAAQNARRNPRRTAATASALMIGLALVGALSVIGASTKASADRLISSVVGADLILSNPGNLTFSPDLADRVRAVPGVASVSQERFGGAKVGDKVTLLTAIDPATVHNGISISMVRGSIDALTAPDTMALAQQVATSRNLSVGSNVPVTFQFGGTRQMRIVGIFERNNALGSYTVSLHTFVAAGGSTQDNYLWVSFDKGADSAKVKAAVAAAAKAYPIVKVQDQSEYKAATRKQVNQFLLLIYALLALAVIIAVLGIVNTLALSVVERTREIGLLRAVGMSRPQLRRMVRLESVLIAVFGAVLGLVLGVGFGVALRHTLRRQGIDVLSVPAGQLVLFLVLAGVIGVLASVWPARRAARLDVLRAVTTE